jgi:hypothetical protein
MQGAKIKLDPEKLLGWQVNEEAAGSIAGVRIGTTKVGETKIVPTEPGSAKDASVRYRTVKVGEDKLR